MKDVKIKDDVHDILSADSQALQTWGQVNTYMSNKAKTLGPVVVEGVKKKLSGQFGVKKHEQKELMRALKYGLTFISE